MDWLRAKYLLRVIPRLGAASAGAAALHKFSVASGLIRLKTPITQPLAGPFFRADPAKAVPFLSPGWFVQLEMRRDALTAGELDYFHFHRFAGSSPPDWFFNPFTETRVREGGHWSECAEFGSPGEDIKCIWEASRMQWAPVFARAHAARVRGQDISMLNAWLEDWAKRNPPNQGPNWRCGQEASFRLINVLLAALFVEQLGNPEPGLLDFVAAHCRRISATHLYAAAQKNNHATSEACALFFGGIVLADSAQSEAGRDVGRQWEADGRKFLETAVGNLVLPDGSFSQRSVNYHRVALDTLALAEQVRRLAGRPQFSELFYARARAAAQWLFQIVDERSGDAPNFGANDGTRMLALDSCDYRDYRPAVQLAYLLFYGKRAYAPGPWDEGLYWLGAAPVPHPESGDPLPQRSSMEFPDGGYVTFHGKDTWGMLHAPRFRFRPSHADALHLDIWYRGRNVICDSGTYSYNCPEPMASAFPGTEAHNTVDFDGRGQMPRLGRFLFGEWTDVEVLQPLAQSEDRTSWCGRFCGYRGAKHRRSVMLQGGTWQIVDEVDDFTAAAVVRWHLTCAEWKLEGNRCYCALIDIHVRASSDCSLVLNQAAVAPYYLMCAAAQVLEVRVSAPGPITIETTIQFDAHS